MKRPLASAGAFVASILASSHHAIHVALVSIGFAAAGTVMGDATRRTMLLASAALTVVAIAWMVRSRPNGPTLAGATAGATASSILLVWSVMNHGW